MKNNIKAINVASTNTKIINDTECIDSIKINACEIIDISNISNLLKYKKKIRIKVGFDPTSPDLHLGHYIILKKIKQFQSLGHEALFLIGDFTGMIGDPTGKKATRKPLDKDEVLQNSKTYKDQALKILDPNRTKILFNSKWLEKLKSIDIVNLASKFTVSRMMERNDFNNRYKNNKPIGIHEFLYPLMQGYDSIFLKSNIEVGGVDQKFNLLVGRSLQRSFNYPPQSIILLPLLEGTDGMHKMSKTLNNHIGINESASNIFGKVMSISDSLMWRYFELVSSKSKAEVFKYKQLIDNGKNPRDIKYILASEITSIFHSIYESKRAKELFIDQFSKKNQPKKIKNITIATDKESLGIASILKKSSLVNSTSEGIRMIKQQAVRINGVKIKDQNLNIKKTTTNIFQVGKHKFANVKISNV